MDPYAADVRALKSVHNQTQSRLGLVDLGTGEITRLQQALVRSARREEAPAAVRPSCQLRWSGFDETHARAVTHYDHESQRSGRLIMLRCVRDTDMQLGRLAPTRIIPEVMIIMILVRELARGLESPNLLFTSPPEPWRLVRRMASCACQSHIQKPWSRRLVCLVRPAAASEVKLSVKRKG